MTAGIVRALAWAPEAPGELREPTSIAEMLTRYRDIRKRLRLGRAAPSIEPPAVPPAPAGAIGQNELAALVEDAYRAGYRAAIDAPEDNQVSPGARRSAHRIIADIASAYGLSSKDLIGPYRAAHIVRARFEAIHQIREETCLSSASIGRLLGGRDHTTILHALRVYKERAATAEDAAAARGRE